MSTRQKDTPPGKHGDAARREPGPKRPSHWPDVVDTVMLPSLRPGSGPAGKHAQLGTDDGPEPAPSQPTDSTRVLFLPRGRHKSGTARLIESSPRRKWVSRAVLAVILGMQALLSLRMRNTAFEDEALYLYAGHMEIQHWLHGAALQGNYASYFSGAPVLYPVLAAGVDAVGGLAAARALSLLEMLTVTGLLYSLTRQLFNERVGLCAAVLFSVTEATLFLGNLATYDATSLCLLALAAWIVVRAAPSRGPAYLLAVPVATLAVATKYAALLFVPTIAVLAGLAALPHIGRKALIRPAAFGAAQAALIAAVLHFAGPAYLDGVTQTTTGRAQGNTPMTELLRDSLLWGGLPLLLAVIGAVAYAWRADNEPGEDIAPAGGRFRRAALGVALVGTALLAPAYQMHLHTDVSFAKHIGFGLFFAAPMAGAGLARVIGDHFRRAQLGIIAWAIVFVLGMTQASGIFESWPNSQQFVSELVPDLRPGAHYLVEADEVPIYYLMGNRDAQPDQFTTTYNISYVDSAGQTLTGTAGFTAAVRAGYFSVIAYNGLSTPALDQMLARELEGDPSYQLVTAISEPTSAGRVTYYVWVRTSSPPASPAPAPAPAPAARPRPGHRARDRLLTGRL